MLQPNGISRLLDLHCLRHARRLELLENQRIVESKRFLPRVRPHALDKERHRVAQRVHQPSERLLVLQRCGGPRLRLVRLLERRDEHAPDRVDLLHSLGAADLPMDRFFHVFTVDGGVELWQSTVETLLKGGTSLDNSMELAPAPECSLALSRCTTKEPATASSKNLNRVINGDSLPCLQND